MISHNALPHEWSVYPLRRLLTKENRTPSTGSGVVTAYRDGAVTLRSLRREAGYTFSDKEQGYQGVKVGDLVFHALDGFAGAVGVSDSNGKCSPVYHVCSMVGNNDARFISYTLRAMAFTGFLELQAGTVRQRSVDFRSWETFARLPIPTPPPEEQRRIADFLDAETPRIDRLSGALQSSLNLLKERVSGIVDAELMKSADEIIPLKYWATFVDTEHKTAPHVPGGGYWIAGTSSVRGGNITRQALYETDAASYFEWTRRRRPRPGDVLLSREAPVGEVGLYRDTDPQIAIGQRMVLVTPDSRHLDPEYLMWSLLSNRVREFYDLKTQGSLHPHLNMSDIGGIPIKRCNLSRQRAAAQHIGASVALNRSLQYSRGKMHDLLAERRQALITAAVTGQFDVTTASGRNVTEGVTA
ncbi:hypothetical protein OIE73_33860 [Streptomyces hirsutus]|uniref:Type I restriction modification DNA specificity domain-containing protein n=1 Tax=Streptomyces hirsutus TaxID=35620 RepID=A0ABZ1GWD3_9ACTN|nr:hypothetical protein [Streptomyces hirsutus]WSD10220.1 hypothetical protein OIE73_33860 [Streptomyces hirsutus]